MMQVELRQTATGWQFKSEADLERFVQLHLAELLQLQLLQQQYSIQGQVCDLLCVDTQQQLTVIELKNSEDRYVIQQLTRYYAALREVRPYSERINYQKPIQLIAIAPHFHRDTDTDRQYSTLSIRLLEFALAETEAGVFFNLTESASNLQVSLPVPVQPAPDTPLPSPPRAFLNLLSPSPLAAQTALTALRTQILQFDQRMQEQPGGGGITYGRGQSKPCAEIRWDTSRQSAVLFLWLPHRVQVAYPNAKSFTARMRLWTEDWVTVTDLGHIPKGLGRMISYREWQQGTVRPLNQILPKNKIRREQFFTNADYRQQFTERYQFLRRNGHYRSGLALAFEYYCQQLEPSQRSNQLSALTQLALQTWLTRL